MNCKFCGQPVEEKPGGHRQREYCNDAHRQAYWRQQHQADQDAALLAALFPCAPPALAQQNSDAPRKRLCRCT